MTPSDHRSIFDVHSHTFPFPDAFTRLFIDQAQRVGRADVKVDLTVRHENYRGTATPGTVTVVFGGKARLSGLWCDDRYVADYANKHRRDTVGFLSIDPTVDGWYQEMRHGHEELGLAGIKLLPMYAGFRMDDPRLDPIWRYAARKQLPVLLHTGTTFVAQAPLECTIPRQLDAAATRHPDVKIIAAHLGHPYEGDCIVTIRKHPNVYADISALHYRPFQLYHSLMLVQEYGVWNKVLFGTDYPFTTVNATLTGLRNLNKMVEGTGLPRLKEDKIEEMIYRDAFAILGIRFS